jgi:hypothetical protein
MPASKTLTERVTHALFSRALGDVFEWGPSVPGGEKPPHTEPPPPLRAKVTGGSLNWTPSAVPGIGRTAAG